MRFFSAIALFFSVPTVWETSPEIHTLSSGTAVAFLANSDSVLGKMGLAAVDFCFPGGIFLDVQPGLSRQCLEKAASPVLGPWKSIQPWVGEESCGIRIEVEEPSLELALVALSKRLSAPEGGGGDLVAAFPERNGPDFPARESIFSLFLRRSPYAQAEQRQLAARLRLTEPETAGCVSLLHSRHTLVIVHASDLKRARQAVGRALSLPDDRAFSQSFGIVEEGLRVGLAGQVFFGQGEEVELALVLPAPARGEESNRPFAALVAELRERLGAGNVLAWSGIGTGFLCLRYRTKVERFPQIAKRFAQVIEEWREEFRIAGVARGLRGDPLGPSDGWEDSARFAARFFWGAGCQDFDEGEAGEEEIRQAASKYLRRSNLLVRWPESRKEEWTGFP